MYKMNVETDFIDPSVQDIRKYKLIIVPALYAAPDSLLKKLNAYVKNGGHVIYTFKSGFSDEDLKVRTAIQPGIINEACGISYSQFTIPANVSLKGNPYQVSGEENKVHTWMELVTPTTAEVLAWYEHPVWGSYAAVTQNQFGKGLAVYVGCMTSAAVTEKIIKDALQKANVTNTDQQLYFPLITKSGINRQGRTIHYYFNYSATPQKILYSNKSGNELLSGKNVLSGSNLELAAWGINIIEEN
jgi:beta-galactosidase